MIRNEREYEAAVAQLGEMDAELEPLVGRITAGEPPSEATRELLRQTDELRGEVERYELLAKGDVTRLAAWDLARLGRSLVEARIARGMGEGELAEAVGLAREELERHEREGYRDAPFRLASEVARALVEETDLRLRLPARAGPWSVLREISDGRPVGMSGRGKLTLLPNRPEEEGEAPPNGPGEVRIELRYDPSEVGGPDVEVNLYSLDKTGAEILSWKPEDGAERTTPQYEFLGELDAPNGRVEAKMSPVYVDFTFGPAGHALWQDHAQGLSAGPGLGSAPVKLRALVPNLYADAEGEAGGVRFRLRPTGEVQSDGAFPDQVGKILPGSFLEMERVEGEEVDLEEAVEAFGWFMSFYAGRAVHPMVWEAETEDGTFWTVQTLRKPPPLPSKFRQTCLPLSALGPFLEQAWGNWVSFGAKRKRHLQGVVNTYEAILATPYPIIGMALTAMYLERFRDHVLGTSELVELKGNKRKNVGKELRDALVEAIEASGRLEPDQKEVLAGSLKANSAKVLGLFRKTFKESLVELHRLADLPIDEEKICQYISQRDLVLHGSWDASGSGTLGTYWVVRYGTWLLERLVLRRFGYEGVYWDRVSRVVGEMPRGEPSWLDEEAEEPSGEDRAPDGPTNSD